MIVILQKVMPICGKNWIKKMKKENLKNVVITFGLIGLVFTQGSLMYQKKLYKGILDTNKQQEELISTQNETLAKIENNNLIDQQNSQITQTPSAVPKTTIPSSTTDKTKTQADIIAKAQQAALLAKQEADAAADAQQAALIAQQQAAADAAAAAKAKLLAQQQADAKAAAAAAARQSSSSRQSSAS